MKCPKCGNDYCSLSTQEQIEGSDYSFIRGGAGYLLFGPFGSMLGWTDKRKMNVDVFWVCKKCGNIFSAE